MSVRAKTGRRRSVHRFVSQLLLWTFGLQTGAVAQAPLPVTTVAPGYRVSIQLAGGSVATLPAQPATAPMSPLAAPTSMAIADSEPLHVPEDPMAPAISAFVVRTLLWPPNHEMWDVGLAVTANDGSGSTLALSVRAYSDEPPNDTGDGDEAPDALI